MKIREIIEAVKQASEGGRAPSQKRFCRETGIQEYDWARLGMTWGEVVEAAGLPPNTFGRHGYDPEEVLGRYAALARELGRVPLRNDLVRKRLRDKSFPHRETYRRFGANKGELMERIVSWCRDHAGWEDVSRLCLQWVTADLDRRCGSSASRSGQARAYVYLIKYGRYYKIGMSEQLDRRCDQIRTQLPQGKARLVHKILTDDPKGIEEYWHKRFAAKRTNGEWFALSPEEAAIFRQRRFM